jgi:hypothetical protein
MNGYASCTWDTVAPSTHMAMAPAYRTDIRIPARKQHHAVLGQREEEQPHLERRPDPRMSVTPLHAGRPLLVSRDEVSEVMAGYRTPHDLREIPSLRDVGVQRR